MRRSQVRWGVEGASGGCLESTAGLTYHSRLRREEVVPRGLVLMGPFHGVFLFEEDALNPKDCEPDFRLGSHRKVSKCTHWPPSVFRWPVGLANERRLSS